MTTCYASGMIAPILTDDERQRLAEAQAALAAVLGKGDTAAEADAEGRRNALMVELATRYDHKRGIKTEMARVMGLHRTTVMRAFVKQKTGRAAYRPAPRRGRAAQ